MASDPVFLSGLALVGLGSVLFGGVPFFYAGASKRAQRRAMGALSRGEHGRVPRLLFLSSFPLLALGFALFLAGALG